ncbi:hypothetical protein [Microbacterium sp. 2FI]|nr:hypothetical protein [Microbacterium sp. 2FI]
MPATDGAGGPVGKRTAPSPARIMMWWIGAAVGLYLVGSGVIGILAT